MTDTQTILPAGWAVPSWVMPGTVAENCRFLGGRVREIALCFFETSGTLAFGPEDLPSPAEAAGMRFHVHLPMDLDWRPGEGRATGGTAALEAAGRSCCRQALAVFAKAAGLAPHAAVLHPPACPAQDMVPLLSAFLDEWRTSCPASLLLENTSEASLAGLPERAPELFADGAFGLCLDLGHLLRYHPFLIEDRTLLDNVRMVHWNVLGERARHLPLTALTEEENSIARRLALAVPKSCLHVIEVFDWSGVRASVPVLRGLLDGR